MLDIKELKAEMVRNGYTQSDLAKALGMSSKTLGARMKTGEFGSKEIEVMVDLLKLTDPMSIFFANVVTSQVTVTQNN